MLKLTRKNNVTGNLSSFISAREERIRTLRRIADDLTRNKKKGHEDVIGARGCGIIGTVLAVGSIPLTGGLSTVVFGLGTGLGLIAAVGGYVDSKEAQKVKRSLLDEARRLLKEDQQNVRQIQTLLEEIQSEQENEVASVAVGSSATILLSKFVAPGIAASAGGIASRVLGGARNISSQFLKVGGVVLGFVSVPLDVMAILENEKKLLEGSEAAEYIYKVIEKLETDLEETRRSLDFLKNIKYAHN